MTIVLSVSGLALVAAGSYIYARAVFGSTKRYWRWIAAGLLLAAGGLLLLTAR